LKKKSKQRDRDRFSQRKSSFIKKISHDKRTGLQKEDELLGGTARGTMKAVRVYQYGDSKVLRCEETPIPAIHPDEVLIKVHAAGVNPVDWKIREGYMKSPDRKLPFIPGWDVAGIIEETGNVK
jgi:hypothetical protein